MWAGNGKPPRRASAEPHAQDSDLLTGRLVDYLPTGKLATGVHPATMSQALG